jgi:hypothetical protein
MRDSYKLVLAHPTAQLSFRCETESSDVTENKKVTGFLVQARNDEEKDSRFRISVRNDVIA